VEEKNRLAVKKDQKELKMIQTKEVISTND
jgi:hypothetical protein